MLSTQLPNNYPGVKGFLWFNWNQGVHTFIVESSTGSQTAFQNGISSSYYASNSFSNFSQDPIQPLGSSPSPTPTPTPTPTVTPTPTPTQLFKQVNYATPSTSQTSVGVNYTNAQIAGDTNIIEIGWYNTTSHITNLVDTSNNNYSIGVTTTTGSGFSQAIYYAKNIKAANANANTVTVSFNSGAPYVDLRILEYSGLDLNNPFDTGTTASGSGTTANSGSINTSSASELLNWCWINYCSIFWSRIRILNSRYNLP